jgi:hypothetical protein
MRVWQKRTKEATMSPILAPIDTMVETATTKATTLSQTEVCIKGGEERVVVKRLTRDDDPAKRAK